MNNMDEIVMMNTLVRIGSMILLDNEDFDADAVYSGISNRIMRKISLGRRPDDWFIISNYELSSLTSSPYYFIGARWVLAHRYHFIKYFSPHDFRNPYSTIYPCYQIDFNGIQSHPDLAKTLNKMNIQFFPYDLVGLPFRV